jgi:hypothetical protein
MAKTLQQLEAEKREAQARKDALYAQYKIDQQIARENAKFTDLTPSQQRQLVKQQTSDSYNTYRAAQSAAAQADWEVEKAQSLAADQAEFGPNATYQESGGGTSTVFRETPSGNIQQLTGNDTNNRPYVPADSPPVPQTSTADQPIPFISDETYLDPLYEPAPTSPTVASLPTSPYDINQDGTVSDSEYLYGDDPLYEPVPTDDELASIQERMDEDAEFAAIDEEFTNLPESQLTAEQIIAEQDAEFADWNESEVESYSSYQAPQPQQDLTQHRNISEGDWRFRMRLSPFADYLYKGPKPGILTPLIPTDGVIFPYTPRITMSQEAHYESYNPTHSNFRGHWYKGSQQSNIIISADFTAQDTAEANYLLAVLHFFRSASKMFYGQDQRRGTPPPILYMTGLGEYQFDEHPAVISMFTYDLPNDVDYIATSNAANTYNPSGSAAPTANTHSTPFDSILNSSAIRSLTSGLNFGAVPTINNVSNYFSSTAAGFSSGAPLSGTSVKGGTTYVPTKLSIQLTMLPISTREQASNFWSLEDFASGEPLTRGVW